jgi:hypothetical protein
MIQEFAEGWMNLFWERLGLADENVETLAQERAMICMNCPSLDRKKDKCMACGCHVEAKIRSKKAFCPKGKW